MTRGGVLAALLPAAAAPGAAAAAAGGAAPAAKRRPFIVSVSGGGFVPMTGAMALARAMSDVNGTNRWGDVTHLGGISGGNWFGANFMYSESFFQAVTDPTVDLKEWIDEYMVWSRKANADLMGPTEFGPQGYLEHGSKKKCPIVNFFEKLIFGGLKNMEKWPVYRWLPYTAATVLKRGIPDINTATYATKAHTLPRTTLVQFLALPPDAWIHYNATYGKTDVMELVVTMADGTIKRYNDPASTPDGRGVLPLAMISEGPGSHRWAYGDDIKQLSLVARCPYKGTKQEDLCRSPPFNTPRTLTDFLPPHPTIAEVTGGSGSAAGLAGSPSVFADAADKFIASWPQWFPLNKVEKYYEDRVKDCMPFGLQSLSSPMLAPGTSVAESEAPGRTVYRFLDGGYVDNTAVPMTLAKAQRDCRDPAKADDLDCSGSHRLILVNDGQMNQSTSGFYHKGSAKKGTEFNTTVLDCLRALFTTPDRAVGKWSAGMWQLVYAPSQTVFAESFPEPETWAPYSTFESEQVFEWMPKAGKRKHLIPSFDGTNFKKKPHRIISYMWSGTLTTVDNPSFGVRGGDKVDVLLLNQNVPGWAWPGLFAPSDRTSGEGLSQAGGTEDVGLGRAVMGDLEKQSISRHGAHTAQQAKDLAPVVNAFLSGRNPMPPVKYQCDSQLNRCVVSGAGVDRSVCESACGPGHQ